MNNTIKETNFSFEGQTDFYRGKVRDVYYFGDKMAMVASDRISAFDCVLPRAIPYKGQVLNQIAAKFLAATADIIPNWLDSTPDPNVGFGKTCTPYKVEMVVRGYLVGHAWRLYRSGERQICGVTMPEGLKENDRFPQPLLTPTIKADEGHDVDISREGIISQGLVPEKEYIALEEYTLALYQRGQEMAKERGLILVDTKYEFGNYNNEIILIDEIHTPDSSRYFYLEGYDERQKEEAPQKQLSKEFVRQWLIENGFQGLEGQIIPEMTDEVVENISARYIELYEKVTGQKFVKNESYSIFERIEKNIEAILK